MWFYIPDESKNRITFYDIGYYSPSGNWIKVDILRNKDEAVGMVNFLNGGNGQIPYDLKKENLS